MAMLVASAAIALVAVPASVSSVDTLAVAPAVAATPAATAGSPALTLTWSKVTTAVAPPPLSGASAVYDSDNRTVVLFGGRTATGTLSDDTWVWDGSSWQDYPASEVQAPPPRQLASMAFDPQLHQLILFGGLGADGQPLNDTWAWNGASWYEQTGSLVAQSPGGREGAAMSNDASGNLVLFGGLGYATTPPVSTTTTTPPAQGAPTSTTTVTGGSTSSASPSSASPSSASASSASASSASASSAAASSAPAGPVAPAALTSANPGTLADTWQWTSIGWTPDPVGGPSPRWGAAMALDAATNQVILTGGDASAGGSTPAAPLGDTWAWNGTSWSKLAPRSAPAARSGAVLTGDLATGGLVLFGGSGAHGTFGDSWLWNGQSWSGVRTNGAPPARTAAAAAFDAGAHELVVFGGIGSGGTTLGDTQVLSGQAPLVLGTGRVPTASSNPGTKNTAPTSATRGHHAAVIPGASATPSGATTTQQPASSGTAGSSSLHVTTHRLHRGDLVTLTGGGFAADASIIISFHSTPTFVGHTNATRKGEFSVTVVVPESAAGGLHHFVATGETSSGHQAELITAVEIVGVPLSRPTAVQTVVLLGLAILLPAGTWCALAAAGWWRRRQPTGA
jgi:hypothetical protein